MTGSYYVALATLELALWTRAELKRDTIKRIGNSRSAWGTLDSIFEITIGAGEMDQQFRSLTCLSEDLSSVATNNLL